MSDFKAKVRLISKSESVVVFTPVTDGSDENKSFSEWTPWGEIRLGITNKPLMETLIPTDEYLVTFTKVPKAK